MPTAAQFLDTEPVQSATAFLDGPATASATESAADFLTQPSPVAPAVVDAVAGVLSMAAPQVPQFVTRAALTKGGRAGDVAAEVVPAIGGAILGAAGGPAGVAVGGATGAAAGNVLAQTRRMIRGEQESIAPGELAAATAVGGVPLGKLKQAATLVETVGRGVARRSVQGAAVAGTAETTRQIVDEKEMQPGKIVSATVLGGGFGSGFGLVENAPALAKALTPATEGLRNKLQRWATDLRLRAAPQSVLPAEIRDQLRFGEQGAAAVQHAGKSVVRDLEAAIKGIGDKNARTSAAQKVNEYLTGDTMVDGLPEAVRPAAQRVRAFVDDLTDRAVAEGVVEGRLAQTFLDNRGKYLRRSYQIFLDPDYKPSPGVINSAIKAVAETNGLARADAEAVVAGLLDKHSRAGLDSFLLGRGTVAGKDISSLIRRRDLLPEIRELLGEVTDPVLAANQTIPRLARLLELDAAQKQVRTIGLKLGVFKEAQNLEFPTPVVPDASKTHDVLSGLYTQPDIAAALQREASSGRMALIPDLLWRSLTTASSIAKASKTVLNPESYAPNFLGGVLMNVANGNFRYQHSARALALGAEEFGALRRFLPKSPARHELRAEIAELKRLGVIGESVNTGDLLRTIESSFFGKLKDSTKSVLTLPSRAYGAVDDFNRYVAWQSERARYAKVFPAMPKPALDRLAAEVARATTPVYSEVPKVMKQLSVAGIVPSFVNFTWEVFRNTKNTVRISLRDIQQGRASGNAAQVRAGAQRLASVMAVTAAASMWGISKLSRDSNGIDESKDRAVRYFTPPWNRDAVLLYTSRAGDGRPVQFANLTYLVPQALLWEAIEAGRRGADDGQMMPEFLRALNGQFGFGNSVLIPGIAGAITGFDPGSGRPIRSTGVEPGAMDRLRHVYEKSFEPLAIAQAEKWQKAFAGEQGDYGRVYTVNEQMKRLMGVRAQTLDPERAVQWKARDIGQRLQAAGAIYRLRLGRNLAPAELEKAYEQANAARRSQWEDMRAMISHTRALGLPDEKTIAALRAARVPAADILGALDGRYPALERSQPITPAERMAELAARPANERAAALAQLYREDPAMGRAVLARVKDAAKGRTETDRLILSLGVTDGERAAYLRHKLGEFTDPAARRAWLLDLRRKGIVTDTVLQQMATAAP